MPPKTILVTPASDVQREIIALTPGDTLVFADGIYRGGFTVPCTGTLADPITIKAANKWKAVIMGNSASEKHGFSVTGSRIRFDGLHVFGALGDGIKFQASKDSSINGTFNTVQNCWIHHNLSNGIGGHFEDVETMALAQLPDTSLPRCESLATACHSLPATVARYVHTIARRTND